MQQPPQGRPPMPPYRPPGTGPPPTGGPPGRPPGAPPPGGGYPPSGVPQGYVPAPPAYAPPAAAAYAGMPRKRRGALRFVAGSCVFSAWFTLVVCLLLAGFSFLSGMGAAGAAASSISGGSSSSSGSPLGGMLGGQGAGSGIEGLGLPGGGTTPNPADALMPLLGGFIAPLFFASGVFSVVTGVVSCLLFLGLGQACCALLDMEEQACQNGQALNQILMRLSAGR